MSKLEQLAEALLRARATGQPIDSVDFGPATVEEAYVVQDLIAASIGEIGGWKIGAASPSDTPFFAPMPKIWMDSSPATIPADRSRLRGVELEIAFLISRDLPVRDEPYSRAEIESAIASVHPAIEIIESGLRDPQTVPQLLKWSDLQVNGGFVSGSSFSHPPVEWSQSTATLRINGQTRVERIASNSAGADLLPLVVFLANQGSRRTKGLKAGQWITTGSWTGLIFCQSGDTVEGSFTDSDTVTVRFA
jgi:2-keto-4-pentenoate hydratase